MKKKSETREQRTLFFKMVDNIVACFTPLTVDFYLIAIGLAI